MNFVLIGAGGHAKAVAEIIEDDGDRIVAYLDDQDSKWLTVPRLPSNTAPADIPASDIALGIGAINTAQLRKRLVILDRYISHGRAAPPIVHPTAWISQSAVIEAGVTILAKAVIQPGVRLGRGAIVNSGAVVEHDSQIGPGSHVSPQAVVLADCNVGSCCMIGAASVVLQGNTVADDLLVKAGSRWPK